MSLYLNRKVTDHFGYSTARINGGGIWLYDVVHNGDVVKTFTNKRDAVAFIEEEIRFNNIQNTMQSEIVSFNQYLLSKEES